MARLTNAAGVVVNVEDRKVDEMTRRGFEAEKSTSRAPAKKATSNSKS